MQRKDLSVHTTSWVDISLIDWKKWSDVSQSCSTLCNPMNYSLPGSSVHGLFHARIMEWVAISFSRRSSRPRDRTHVSCIVCRHFTIWATREALGGSVNHKVKEAWLKECILYDAIYKIKKKESKTIMTERSVVPQDEHRGRERQGRGIKFKA